MSEPACCLCGATDRLRTVSGGAYCDCGCAMVPHGRSGEYRIFTPYGPAIRFTEFECDGRRWLRGDSQGLAFPLSEIALLDMAGEYRGAVRVCLKTEGGYQFYAESSTLPAELQPPKEDA